MNAAAIFSLVILLALAVGLWLRMRHIRCLKLLLELQALKRGGRVISGSWWTLPHLVMMVDGAELRVSARPAGIVAGNSRGLTSADIAVSGNQQPLLSLCERGSKLVNSIADKLPKGRDVLMGNSGFDMRFRVSGQDPARIRAFVEKQRIARRLLDLPEGVGLECSEGRCVLSIAGVAKEGHILDLLIDAAVEISRALMAPESASSAPNGRRP